jgi:DNA-binding MarR family transcriptional regulator
VADRRAARGVEDRVDDVLSVNRSLCELLSSDIIAVNVSSSTSRTTGKAPPPRGTDSPAFLLAQLGAHAASRFAERLSVLDLAPPHAGILRLVSASGGISQQALAGQLRILPSRLVILIDQLEGRGLLERRADPADRRSYALHLTDTGGETLKSIGRLARDHQDALLVSLTADEREVLASLLRRVADQQGLRPGVHPGFSKLHPQGRHPSRSSKRRSNR